MRRVLCINTGGAGDLHEKRARRLCGYLDANIQHFDIDRTCRGASANRLWHLLSCERWDLVYQESTGVAGGLNLIAAALRHRQRYIVSSGDSVQGFWEATHSHLLGFLFGQYERMLLRKSIAFIGWTPYLTGRALELGAPRAVTVEGAVDLSEYRPLGAEEQRLSRARFGIPLQNLVCGIIGTLKWTARQSYCYGLELIEVLNRVKRTDISMLIVGDGDGVARLKNRIPGTLLPRVIFTGRLEEREVISAINVMDVGFITQTMDKLGSFRLTTKLPEYLACGVPIAMSPVPGFFDYALEAGWALPAVHPANTDFYDICALWLDRLTTEEVLKKASYARVVAEARFSYDVVGERFRSFVSSLLGDLDRASSAKGCAKASGLSLHDSLENKVISSSTP